jgi:hypothetical protein
MRSTRLRKARRLHPTFDGIPVAEVMKTIIDPPIVELEKAIRATTDLRSLSTSLPGRNACHTAASKPFIRIQRPINPPLTNQNFAPLK